MTVPEDSRTRAEPADDRRGQDPGDTEIVAARRLSVSERAPFWSLRLHARQRFAHSLVIVPTMYLLAAVLLGLAIPAIDRSSTGGGLLGITSNEAQAILESIAAGMVAFSGLVVSVAVLVVQFGAGQYSPRLVPSFRSDAVIKNALGLFVAPGVYALVAAANVGGSTNDKVGTATVLVALALMVAALVALFRFIGRLLDLMRPRRIYARLLDGFALAVDDVYPHPDAAGIELCPLSTAPVSSILRHRHRNELLIGVDRARLVQAARAADAIIEVAAPIGSHVGDDTPILLIRGGSSVDPTALRVALTFADGRRIQEDPAFAIRCTVDVAIRALSPAVNDPTSAVEGLDALEAMLTHLGHRPLQSSAIKDDDGHVRLLLPSPGWDELVDLALTEVRWYGADAPQVARRMTALLDRLTELLPPERHAALLRQRHALELSLARIYHDPDELAFVGTADDIGIGGSRRPSRRW
ncbi:MAG TPA: DUF2254 family protein [Solirubrobacteraceae bacterium]